MVATPAGVIAGLPLAFATLHKLAPDIAVAGGIRPVLARARAHAGHLVTIEIEVDTLAQLREVLDTALADVVLLDNMDIPTLTEAVKIAQGRVVLEASGGVTLESIANI